MTVDERHRTAVVVPRSRFAVAPITYLRVLGFLTVLTFHAYQSSGYDGFAGWPGEEVWERLLVGGAAASVDAFFVITTFLCCLPVVRGALSTAPMASGRTLLVRKASALLPAYYLAVLLVWAISNPRLPGNWADLLLHLTFTQVFSDTYIFWTLGPAWFIAVAALFHVVVAIGAGPLQRRCRRLPDRRSQVRVILGVVAGLVAVCWVYKLTAAFLFDVPAIRWSVWFGPLSRIDLLGTGLGLALVAVLRPRISVLAGRLLRGTAAAVALVGVLAYPNEIVPGSDPAFWQDSVLGLAAALLLLPSICAPDRDERAVRGAPWGRMVTLATLTYGVYIWQEPILRVLDSNGVLPPDSSPWAFPVTTLLLLLLSLAVAKIGYHLIEEPGRSIVAWSQRRTAPTGAGLRTRAAEVDGRVADGPPIPATATATAGSSDVLVDASETVHKPIPIRSGSGTDSGSDTGFDSDTWTGTGTGTGTDTDCDLVFDFDTCTDFNTDTCTDFSTDTCTDFSTDTCTDFSTGTHTDFGTGTGTGTGFGIGSGSDSDSDSGTGH